MDFESPITILEDNPLVSVIIPTHNRPEMLKEALSSVLSQSFRNFEIVVINDGGQDVQEVIDSLKNESEGKIVYIQHKKNKGLSSARNTGLKTAKGKYIAYLDDDDIYYPSHLETLIGFLEKNDCGVAYTDAYQVFQLWKTDHYTTDYKKIFGHEFNREDLLISNYIHLNNVVHRKNLIEAVGGFDENLSTHEDWDFLIRLAQKSDFYYLETITAEFRFRPDKTNMTTNKREDMLKTLRLIHKRYSHLVTSPVVLEAQKKIEQALVREVDIIHMDSTLPAYERLHRYRLVKEFVKSKKTLVLSSGEGLGSFILSEEADSVTGIEDNEENLELARSKYCKDNLTFLKGSPSEIPLAGENLFDVIVFLESFEEVENQALLISEVKRLIKNDGLFFVSVPSRKFQDQVNRVIKPEGLFFDEFSLFLKGYFKTIKKYGQTICPVSNIYPFISESDSVRTYIINKGAQGYFFDSPERDKAPYYLIIASDLPLIPVMGDSFLIDTSNTMIKEKEAHLSYLEEALRDKDIHLSHLDQIRREKDKYLSHLEQTLGETKQTLGETKQALGETKQALKEKSEILSHMEQDLTDKDQQLSNLRVLEDQNQRISQELALIKSSLSWRLVSKFRRSLVEKWLPPESKRRHWYRKGVQAIKHLPSPGKNKKNPIIEDIASLGVFEDAVTLETQRKTVFPYSPTISVIVPTYNTPKNLLKEMVESVLNQTYSNFEICLADGGSKEPHIREMLNAYASQDKRVKVQFLERNMGISGNSNRAISMAGGDYLALLDHDDVLSPSALFEIVKVLNENPEAQFLYSDYCLTDQAGMPLQFVFGPDFSRFYYLSHPYLVHLIAFKRTLLEGMDWPGFDEDNFNGGVSQDVDLFLRLFARLEDKYIIHIPKVLYFWRQYEKSAGHQFQDQVHSYTKKAIGRYLETKKLDGWVEDGLTFNTFRVRFKIAGSPLVSIIIPTKDKWQLLDKDLKSIKENADYPHYEIVIIKNNTEDPEAIRYLDSIKDTYTVVDYPHPFNFSRINNFAVKLAKGSILLFLNDDIEFKSPGFLRTMVELVQLKEVGIVGSKLLYPDGRIQHAGVIIGLLGIAEHVHKFLNGYRDEIWEPGYISSLVAVREYSAVTGACLMTKKAIFTEVGGFSEELSVGYNDIDFCLKVIGKGYKVLYTPFCWAFHHESASRRNNEDLLLHPEDRSLFSKKWAEFISKGDPYYNPNLDLTSYLPQPKIRDKTPTKITITI
jgi:glycosyltransferase involved in cell wall biosynthesis